MKRGRLSQMLMEAGDPVEVAPHWVAAVEAYDISFLLKRDWCGVYLIYRDEELIYVGQSLFVLGRVYQHLFERNNLRGERFSERTAPQPPDAQTANRVLFIPCQPADLNALEGALIRKYEPEWNGGSKRKLHGRIMAPAQKAPDNLVLAKYALA